MSLFRRGVRAVNVPSNIEKTCPHGAFPQDRRERPLLVFPSDLTPEQLATLEVCYLPTATNAARPEYSYAHHTAGMDDSQVAS